MARPSADVQVAIQQDFILMDRTGIAANLLQSKYFGYLVSSLQPGAPRAKRRNTPRHGASKWNMFEVLLKAVLTEVEQEFKNPHAQVCLQPFSKISGGV